MGGPNLQPQQATAQAQTQLSQQQLALGQQEFSQSQANTQQMQALLQPSINFNSKIASGDQSSLMTALAPQLTNITQAKSQNAGQIMEQVGPGAARDVALANNTMSSNDQVASLKNQTYTSAMDKLANIGTGLGSFSIQQLGAALSGFSGSGSSLAGASTTQQSVLQAQSAQKASTMGFLGELAGAGGSALSGGFAAGGAFASDVRLKENIVPIGQIRDVPFYSFTFIGDDRPQIGVMAQELFQTHPEFVIPGGDDPTLEPWRVDYVSLLDKMAKN